MKFTIALLLSLTWSAGLQAAICSVSANGVNFGIYDPLASGPNDSTGDVTVSCIGLLEVVGYSVNISKGNSNNYATRFLKAGTLQLNYNLYNATSRTAGTIWGDTTSSTVNKTGSMTFVILVTPTLQTETFTIFGRIPALQNAGPGDYSDTITVTVTY